jgi:hypothetical protein
MRTHLLAVPFLALALLACQLGGASPGASPEPTATGPTAATAAAEATAAPGEAEPIPTVDGFPPQTNAAVIQPDDRREELTRLSTLLDFNLTGLHQSPLGVITDYVINTCETYIIYMLVEPAVGLDVEPGQRLVVPYEAVTINNGIVDAEAESVALHLAPGDLAGAPAFPDPLVLYPITWEDSVRGFWREQVRIGKLHSACQAGNSTPENAIYKIAYARQLLVAELKDGNQNLLGAVREAILEPSTGKLGFYVIELTGGGLVLVPLARTNIPEFALEPGATIELVLLAENSQLAGAPRLSSLEEAASQAAQNTARGYWGQ